jgi:homoserine kinase
MLFLHTILEKMWCVSIPPLDLSRWRTDSNAFHMQIFNLQRLAVLTTALAQSPPNPELVFEAMKDRIHQPYREALVLTPPPLFFSFDVSLLTYLIIARQIPGLTEVTTFIKPSTHPGLLGICLSGAGPTILALATSGFQAIAEDARALFKQHDVEIDWEVLSIAGGSTVVEKAENVKG